jgi:hypothetical protein
MAEKQVVVVVPFYKNTLNHPEKISLAQLFRILGNHPIVAIKPISLSLSPVEGHEKFAQVISFDDAYFYNIQGYNDLMLSENYYGRFLAYRYMLIHQLDAFVFRDELQYWCTQNYDYVGAPWLKRLANPDIFKEIKTQVITRYHQFQNTFENGLPSDRQFDNVVGNGGFSLRHTRKFYELTQKFDRKIQAYRQRHEHQFHEDVFWSIEVNRHVRNLRIPGYKKALRFSFENRPEQCMMHTGNRLPFGCHAWDQYTDFWRPYLEKQGIVV